LAWKRATLLLAVFLLPPIVYFGPSGYRKAQMDKEVDRLCAVDGGIRVFEHVLLPSSKFDQFGFPTVPLTTSKAAKDADFVIDDEIVEVVKGDLHGRSTPSLHKSLTKVVRVFDKKVLGTSIGYYRYGGDPDGPWHPSHYMGCTEELGKRLVSAVFSKSP